MLLLIRQVKATNDDCTILRLLHGLLPKFKLGRITCDVGVQDVHYARAIQSEVHSVDLVHQMGAQLPLAKHRCRAADNGIPKDNLLVSIRLVNVALVGNTWQPIQKGLEDGVNELTIHLRLFDLMWFKVLGFPRQCNIHGLQKLPVR